MQKKMEETFCPFLKHQSLGLKNIFATNMSAAYWLLCGFMWEIFVNLADKGVKWYSTKQIKLQKFPQCGLTEKPSPPVLRRCA